jgi:uncharacterized protein YkwD
VPAVQRAGQFLGSAWQFVRQRRSIVLVTSIIVVAVIASCTLGAGLGARSLNPVATPTPLSYQAHAGVAYLTPTPTPTPPSANNKACPPVAGHEDSAMEAWLLNAVNQARKAAGVAPLTIDARIHGETLQHSMDMTCYGFGHYVPPGTTPASRMAAAGISFTWHGENIGEAGQGTDLQKVTWLFNSMMAEKPPNDGHRQNILSPHFTRTGIGIYLENGSGGLWQTEDFTG